MTDIEASLGIEFRNPALLEHALVHGSHVNESQDVQTASNERLEFLGDAVLGMVVTEALYLHLPEAGEGTLTALRSTLVRRETLASVARRLRLGSYLRLGRGEAASGGRNKDRNLADALEAMIGAIYLDQGYNTTREVLLRYLHPHIQTAEADGVAPNHKALLQEYLQATDRPLPHYRIISATGPDHAKRFTVQVLLHDTALAQGTGGSRKAAEMAAARHALALLHQKEE